MLSRIADSLYWLTRYMERADGLLRSAYVHYIVSLDRSSMTGTGSWRPVLELFAYTTPDTIKGLEQDTAAALQMLLIEEGNGNSLKSIVNKARENARGAQDHLTKEVWEEVNSMYHLVNSESLQAKLGTDEAIKVISSLSKHTTLFAGITDITMSRGLGWNFMNLGKFVERCLQTIDFTHKQLGIVCTEGDEATDILQWRYLLLSLSGYELHLKTYRSPEHTYNVLQQVVLNENFTRSVIYSLIRINYYLENIMIIHEDKNGALVRSFGQLFSKVRYIDLQAYNCITLQDFLLQLRRELLAFHTQLSQYYFSYS